MCATNATLLSHIRTGPWLANFGEQNCPQTGRVLLRGRPEIRPRASQPVAERPPRRRERDPGPGDPIRRERRDLEGLGVQSRRAAEDASLERDDDDGGLEPGVETDDLARLHDEARLLERLANRSLRHRLVDLEEAARLRPAPPAWIDPAPEQHDLAVVRDGQRGHDETWIDVGHEPARRAGEPVAVLVGKRAERQLRPAARAVVEAGLEPARDPPTGIDIGRARVRPPTHARQEVAVIVRRLDRRHANSTSRLATPIAARPITATATHARRKSPRPRFTGSQAHAERQIRTIASIVVIARSGAPTRTQSLTRGLPSGTPTSSAVIAIVPRTSTGTDTRT